MEIMRSGQRVQIEGMTRELPALEDVRAMLNDIENELRELARQESKSPRSRLRVVVPV